MSNNFPPKSESLNNIPNAPQFSQVGNSNQAGYAQPAPRTNAISIIGLIFCFLSPVLGLLLSIIAWIVSKYQGNKVTVAIIGTVIGLIGTAVSIYLAVVILPTLDLTTFTSVN